MNEAAEVTGKFKRARLDAEEAELDVRLKSLQVELVGKQVENTLLVRSRESRERSAPGCGSLRGADGAIQGRN